MIACRFAQSPLEENSGVPFTPALIVPPVLRTKSLSRDAMQNATRLGCVPYTELQVPSVDGGVETGGDGEESPQELLRVVRGGTPGEFNLYIFAMSWKAEW